MTDGPKVSIGMPVFNGDCYLEEAISSILSQSYTNFELIISDNASTDRTREICETFLKQDQRVSYFRNDKNLGAAWNFNHVFALSSGEYFKWAAHDDVVGSDFLARCVEVLDNEPDVVLCHAKVRVIDHASKVIGEFRSGNSRLSNGLPHQRFGELICSDMWCFEVFGLIRSSVLKNTQLISSYVASDRVLRAHLGLLGRFHEVPEYLFLSRDHPERSVRALPAHQQRILWFDPANVGKISLPHWRIFVEYLKCAAGASLDTYERWYCYCAAVYWMLINLNWARMAADLIIALRPDALDSILHLVRNKPWLPLSEPKRSEAGGPSQIDMDKLSGG